MPLLSQARADAKVAVLLVNLTERCGEGDGMLLLPLSRGAMAETLALTIETVSRQMTALEKAGLIEGRGLRGSRVPGLAALVNVSG